MFRGIGIVEIRGTLAIARPPAVFMGINCRNLQQRVSHFTDRHSEPSHMRDNSQDAAKNAGLEVAI